MNTCPHCGAEFKNIGGQRQHARTCLQRPGMEGLIHECLEDADHPGAAVSVRVYAARAAAVGAASDDALRRAFGAWPEVCARFGLVPGGRRRASEATLRDREAAAIAETESAVEAAAKLRAAEWDRGLEVCRVRPVRGGVAYELR